MMPNSSDDFSVGDGRDAGVLFASLPRAPTVSRAPPLDATLGPPPPAPPPSPCGGFCGSALGTPRADGRPQLTRQKAYRTLPGLHDDPMTPSVSVDSVEVEALLDQWVRGSEDPPAALELRRAIKRARTRDSPAP